MKERECYLCVEGRKLVLIYDACSIEASDRLLVTGARSLSVNLEAAASATKTEAYERLEWEAED